MNRSPRQGNVWMYCGCCGLSTSAREQLARVAVFLADIAEMVEPETSVNLLADEADNRIRECAVAGAADRIVTGDKEMLALGGFGGVRISNLRSYLGSG